MAKKKQTPSRSKSSPPKSKQPASHLFMTSPRDDFAAFFSLTGKGPHKDQVSVRLTTPTPGSGTAEPGSREK